MEINHILKNKIVQASAISVGAGILGAVGGYIFGKRRGYVAGKVEALETIRAEIASENERVRQLSFFDVAEAVTQSPVIVVNPAFNWDEMKKNLPDSPVVQALAKEEARIDTRFSNEKVRYDLLNNRLSSKETLYIPATSIVNADDDEVDIHVETAHILTVDEPEELTVNVDPAMVNVFAHDDAGWDYEEELSTRAKGDPYVIHIEEYIADEMDFRQETLTFYAGDDIMVDSDDTPIYNYAGLMGELKFGHGSRDQNVVYIRNEVLHMEWEILLNPGMFAQEILGLEMEEADENELKHSVQKFRRE